MRKLVDCLAGALFGVGLLLSGMTNPAKVQAFLDLAGPWDPSLMLVMGGAILVGVIGFSIARKRQTSWLGEPMKLPTATTIDKSLVIGSLLFGAGWGLAGFCPGPALVSAAIGYPSAILFTVAMLAGMALHALYNRISKNS